MESNIGMQIASSCKDQMVSIGAGEYITSNSYGNNNSMSKRVINTKGGGKNGVDNNNNNHHNHPSCHVERGLECPRCESSNTKFCYYNNYSKSQPRHFCKNCRRYWTHGGALRNVPIGGGCRKNNHSPIPIPNPNPNPNPNSIPNLSLNHNNNNNNQRVLADMSSASELVSDTSSSISSCNQQLKISSDAGLIWYNNHNGYGSDPADLCFPFDDNNHNNHNHNHDHNPPTPYTFLNELINVSPPPQSLYYLHPGDDWNALGQPPVLLQYMKEEGELEPLVGSVEVADYSNIQHHQSSNILQPPLPPHSSLISFDQYRQTYHPPPPAISSLLSSELVNNNNNNNNNNNSNNNNDDGRTRVASNSSSSTANAVHHDSNADHGNIGNGNSNANTTSLPWLTTNGPASGFLWPTEFDH